VPAAQRYSAAASIIVTSTGDPRRLVEPLRAALQGAEPAVAILDAQTLAEWAGLVLAPLRWAAVGLGVLAALGLAIAMLGVYGAMAFLVSGRTREFGVRRALGATGTDIYANVVTTGSRIMIAGIVPGVGIGLLGSGLLQHLLFGISPYDPTTFVLVPTGLLAVGVVTAAVAGRRAVRVDPNVALRNL
jgi:predicted lysophospholipase L1 biosynthesis ABC-type transport system permease subunit